MSFLNSLPLWAGLAALGVAVPILIHLWSRNQKFETPWAAMELLKKALIARSQKIQVEDILLLILRCLAMILIAMALLRPLLNSSGNSGVGGKSVGVVIGIDASYSMNHGEHARFEKAIGKAREVLSTIGQGDPVSIILMSEHPEVLFRRTSYEPVVFARALDELDTASSYSLNLERNLERLDELVSELKTATRECYIITDAQVSDWQGLSDQGRSSLRRMCDESRVILAPVSADDGENLVITDFAYSAGSLQREGSARFAANIRNTGMNLSDGASVEFFADGKLKTREDVGPLEAGETRSASFYMSFDSAGDIALTARLSKDDLPDDNERHAIAAIRSSLRVLCVDGDFAESTRKTPRGGYYLVRALRLRHHDEQAPIRVVHIDASDLFSEKLSDYDIVVMVNVPDVSEDTGIRLHQFSQAGGGLMIFLGDKVDPEQYNKYLSGDKHPVLPARLVETAEHTDPKEGWRIATVKSDHPLARVVSRIPADLTEATRFKQTVRAIPLKGSESILELDDGTLPLLLGPREKRSGRVLLFTSSADRTWSNFPLQPLFTILLQQSATMLSNPTDLAHNIVGEPATVPLPGRRIGDKVTITDPREASSTVKATHVEGSTACIITPETSGIYQIAADSGHKAMALAVNVNTAESEVRAANIVALKQWFEEIPMEVASEGLAGSVINSRNGRDISLLLLTLGIVCFFGQGLAANYLSRRKHADSGDVAASLKGRRVAASRRY